MSIPIHRPTLRRRDFNSVLNCLVSDRIGEGPVNHELASLLAHYLGVAGGVCLSTYISAIHCALEALELGPQDPVIVSALAPAEYLIVLARRGLVPLIADVDPATAGISLAEIEKYMAAGSKAIILHYTLGLVPGSDEIFTLGIPVLEDISQSLGGSIGGARCGSLGQVSVLSLSPEGIITAAGGAAVFSRDRRVLRAVRECVDRGPKDILLPDLNAALGLAQAKEIDGYLKARQAVSEIFIQAVTRSRHGTLLPAEDGGSVPYGFPVLVKDGLKQVRQYALKKGIETSTAFSEALVAVEQAAGGGPPADGWQESQTVNGVGAAPAQGTEKRLPNAKDLLWRCLLFPLYPTLLKRDVQLIAKVLSTLP